MTPGGEWLASHQVKATTVDVGVPATVDDKLIPRRGLRRRIQIGVGDKPPVVFTAQKQPVACRDEEQVAVREPIDTSRKCGRLQDYFTVSGEINGNDLRRTPVGKPQTVLVPPGLLTKGDPGHQDLELRLRKLHCAHAGTRRTPWTGSTPACYRSRPVLKHGPLTARCPALLVALPCRCLRRATLADRLVSASTPVSGTPV
jgi:hypothetical protein